MKCDGRFTYKKQLKKTINNIYTFLFLTAWILTKKQNKKKRGFWKLLVRAVMKIYNMRVSFFFFLSLNIFSFGKLLSSQDDKKKSNRKS